MSQESWLLQVELFWNGSLPYQIGNLKKSAVYIHKHNLFQIKTVSSLK